jgi:ABC-type methionine transport system ATPase subunit
MVVLDAGRIIESGAMEEVWAHPRELQTQRLLAACLPLEPAAARERLRWLRPATDAQTQSTSSMPRP